MERKKRGFKWNIKNNRKELKEIKRNRREEKEVGSEGVN